MQEVIKYRFLFFISVAFFSLKLSAQLIAPLSFTPTGSFNANTRINACVEDSVNNRLYFQNSCICGVGPGNVISQVSYADLLTNLVATPYIKYNPLWVHLIGREMHYSGGRVYTVDGEQFNAHNVPVYSTAWTYSPSSVFNPTVMASVIRNDSVFTITNDGINNCLMLELRNKNTGALLTFNTIDCSFSNEFILGSVSAMKIYRNKLYITGAFQANDQFSNPIEYNITSINIRTGKIVPLNFNVNDTIKDMEFYNSKIHISGNFTSVKGQSRNYYAVLDTAGNLQANTPSFNNYVEKIVLHDNYLLALGKFTLINSTAVNPGAEYMVKAVNLNTNTVMNWNIPYLNPITQHSNFMMEKGRYRLFMSDRSNPSGLILEGYCLPPVKSTTLISAASTTLCEQTTNLTFSVAPFQYASSYNWSYSGLGASIVSTNNIATISFGLGATSGKLKMCAVSPCGGVSDTLVLNVTVYPRPNALASLVDDTLNCFKKKVPLLGSSTTPGVGYAWSGPSGYSSSFQNDSTGYHLPGIYTLTVTTLATGCTRTASALVRIDTIKPNVTLPPGPYLVGCGTSSLIALNGTSSTTPTTLWWKNTLLSTYTVNPASVSLGNYFLEARNTYNGCIKASPTISVGTSAAQPTVTLTSHVFINSALAVDSVTCFNPTVTLSAAFSPTNCTIVWKDNATGTLSANPVNVFGQSYQKAIVTRLDNSCIDSSMIVFVKQNVAPPNLLILNSNPNINCSSSTATLNAAFSPTPAVGVWTGPSSFSSSNPATTSVQGKYYFTVTRADNGCIKKDSVNVGYNNILLVMAGNDTTVCKSSVANLTAAAVGTIGGITYAWSNGGSGPNISVNPVMTTTYIVTANGPAGCTGKDTVIVNIPVDMQDSIVTTKGCTGNNGSLVIYVKGGIPPYKYSVNGSLFSSQTTYTNLPFATYSVSINDSIGCILNTTATISSNSNLNSPVFIASTQNFKGDTIVLIDLTTPKADSVKWILPGIASIIGGDMFSPVVVFADTGSFPVTLQAFYGTCMTSTTKIIKIMPWDSAYASLSNNNGIKSLSLYPNPNNGQFTVQVEFYKKQNASVQIWDSQPQKHYQQNFLEVDSITLPVNATQLQNGTYILKVISEYASKHFYFVISK